MNASTTSSGARTPAANGFSMKPLMFETFVCTLAMMSFVALIGPISRVLGLTPWQAGLAVTVGGIAWVLFARRWGAASGIGMVAGPGVAGALAAHSLELPLFITAALPFIALAVLWRWLPRAEHHAVPDKTHLKISDARLRRPMAVAFAAMFSVTIAQVVVGFFALDRLHLDATAAARAAGIALTVVGVALILAQLLVRRLGWPPERLIRIGGVVSAFGFGSVMLATTQPALWAGYFVAAAGMGWVFPAVTALAANSVNANEQGATAGTVGAAHGLGMIAGPLAGTLVYDLDPGAPYALIAVLLVLVVLWPARSPAPRAAPGH